MRALRNIDRDITLMTHFAASDEFDNPLSAEQIARFDAATAIPAAQTNVVQFGGAARLAASRAATGFASGGLLYGLSVVDGKSGADLGFEPAMTLSTKLIAINRVRKGERVGYAATYECPEDMPIGVAAIGYGDGYPRSAQTGTPVLINGLARRSSAASRWI